jgi:hypothetical protein
MIAGHGTGNALLSIRQFGLGGEMKQNLSAVVVGCLIAITLWNLGEWLWKEFRLQSLWFLFIAWLLLQFGYIIRKWYRGKKGLDQWPTPYGRYYDEWMKPPHDKGDYYDWLAREMGNQEPWITWARMDADLK